MAEPAGRRAAMLLLAIGEGLALLLSAFFAMMSVMMFDAPGSTERADLNLAFWSIWAVPPALLVGTVFAVLAAVRFTRRRVRIALWVPTLAFVWAVIAMAMIK